MVVGALCSGFLLLSNGVKITESDHRHSELESGDQKSLRFAAVRESLEPPGYADQTYDVCEQIRRPVVTVLQRQIRESSDCVCTRAVQSEATFESGTHRTRNAKSPLPIQLVPGRSYDGARCSIRERCVSRPQLRCQISESS